jgi:hypothetical protein
MPKKNIGKEQKIDAIVEFMKSNGGKATRKEIDTKFSKMVDGKQTPLGYGMMCYKNDRIRKVPNSKPVQFELV